MMIALILYMVLTHFCDLEATDAREIKIYLDQRRCDRKAIKHYHKIYISNCDFTMEVFRLIFKTYKASIDDIYMKRVNP